MQLTYKERMDLIREKVLKEMQKDTTLSLVPLYDEMDTFCHPTGVNHGSKQPAEFRQPLQPFNLK